MCRENQKRLSSIGQIRLIYFLVCNNSDAGCEHCCLLRAWKTAHSKRATTSACTSRFLLALRSPCRLDCCVDLITQEMKFQRKRTRNK
mmetsp:Transcript_22959/g.48854  ORF Transcript_22959/g.48854 Transcript_22959/m.48854 type:complete len:88 (+) Transcript_22959:376-639(+)